MNIFRIRKKAMLQHLAAALVFAFACLWFLHRQRGAWEWEETFFLTGLLFFCIGLYRVTRWLGFYDLPIYGFKKLAEVLSTRQYRKEDSKLGDYADYLQTVTYSQPISEALITGIGFLLLSGAAALFG